MWAAIGRWRERCRLQGELNRAVVATLEAKDAADLARIHGAEWHEVSRYAQALSDANRDMETAARALRAHKESR